MELPGPWDRAGQAGAPRTYNAKDHVRLNLSSVAVQYIFTAAAPWAVKSKCAAAGHGFASLL